MTFIYELGPVFPEDLPDVQNLTSCVKAFESYRYYRHANRQTDRHTDTTEIIHLAASRVVNNTNVADIC